MVRDNGISIAERPGMVLVLGSLVGLLPVLLAGPGLCEPVLALEKTVADANKMPKDKKVPRPDHNHPASRVWRAIGRAQQDGYKIHRRS